MWPTLTVSLKPARPPHTLLALYFLRSRIYFLFASTFCSRRMHMHMHMCMCMCMCMCMYMYVH